MSTIYFTSDLHFDHANIIKYCNRPFNNVEEMNYKLIENWNSVVNHNDTVYVIGDFCMSSRSKKYLSQLNGRKILILGNHDKQASLSHGWAEIHNYLEITYNKQFIVMCHYAFKVWNRSHYGSWNIYGHSHGSLPDDPYALAIDVGIDCHNYTPVSFDEVKRIMAKKTPKAKDVHQLKTNL